MRRKQLFKFVCNMCLMMAVCLAGDFSTLEFKNSKQASSLAHVAFEHARDTGDFWVAEKLLQAAACLANDDPKLLASLGDVQMKLGRPVEALLAWRAALELDPPSKVARSPGFANVYARRVGQLEAQTTPNRWEQALAMANGSAWHCALGQEHVAVGLRPPSPSSSKHPPTSGTIPQNDEVPEGTAAATTASAVAGAAAASAAAAAAAVETVALFATPVVVVRVPALLAAWKQAPIDDASLVELALEGYRDAHAEGTFTDEVHGPLSSNNQFFEYQMAHASAASAQALQDHATGWPQLASAPAWQSVVATVRRVLREHPALQAAFKTVRASPGPSKDSAANDGGRGQGRHGGETATESKHPRDSSSSSDSSGSSGSTSSSHDSHSSSNCSSSAAHSSTSFEDPLVYGWLSVHQGPPPHPHSPQNSTVNGSGEKSSIGTSAGSNADDESDATRHAMHAHLDARLSAVYYAAVPRGANHAITFYDPRGVSPHLNLRLPNDLPAPPFSAVARHAPQPGDLLLFPSWLVHSVDWSPGSATTSSFPLSGDQVVEDADTSKTPASPTSTFAKTTANAPPTAASAPASAPAAAAAAPEVARARTGNVRVSVSFNIGEGWEGTAPVHVELRRG